MIKMFILRKDQNSLAENKLVAVVAVIAVEHNRIIEQFSDVRVCGCAIFDVFLVAVWCAIVIGGSVPKLCIQATGS